MANSRKKTDPAAKAVTTAPCAVCNQQHPATLVDDSGTCVYCRVGKNGEEAEAKAKVSAEEASEARLKEQRAERVRLYRDKQAADEKIAARRAAEAPEEGAFDAQEAARAELARRKLAHDHLLPLVLRVNPEYLPGWVHKDICEHLEWFSQAVAAGESPRLIINMPPRSGKSELASRVFPAWHLGRNPSHEIIACSYAGSLANDFSKKVRGLLREQSFQTVFPEVSLSKDSQSVETWNTNKGGGYVAAGVGGPITGRGAHVLVIDDPLKNREDAESASTRESIWDWYTSTAYTRLAPGGGVIVMMTRWHDDDLGGRLLQKMDQGEGDDWRVVRYPAIAEHDELFRDQGEALHPERYPVNALERIKRTIGPRDWSALYQQNPVADDGDYFKREDFQWYKQEDLPPLEEMNFYTAWDLAIGQNEINDFTVGITVGVDRKDNIYVVDVQRGRWGSLEIIERMMRVQRVWKAKLVGIERGHILMTMGPILEKRCREERLMMPIEELRPGKQDKIARARPIQARMQQHRVFFRKECDATLPVVAEMMRFPNGKHDDACLVAGTRVSVTGGRVPIERLKAGDSVLTPAGPRTVTDARCTGEVPIYRLETTGGQVIEGSGNHPIFTRNRGFVRMDTLEWYDELLTESLPCPTSKSRWSTASPSAATQARRTATTGSIGKRTCRTRRLLSTCTAICGSAPTALYRAATTSTMPTRTPSTTPSVTSSVSRRPSTPLGTSRPFASEPTATSSSTTSTPSGLLQRLGTALSKAVSGTRSTVSALGKDATGTTSPASPAVWGSELHSLVEHVTAPNLAETASGSEPTSGHPATSSLGHPTPASASTAEPSISPSSEPSGVSAQLRAGTLTPTRVARVVRTDRVEPVYNLTVAGEHVYFAEGVLTHNCDTMAWVGQMLTSYTSTRAAKPKPKASWRDKLSKTIRSANHRTAMNA